jgi:putative acetyltransferase
MHNTDASVREERAEDVADIRYVNEAAFGRPAEARLIALLRSRGGTLLSLVSVVAGRVVGHILFSPVSVGSPRTALQGAGLGPMAVLPEFQRRGIGSQLALNGIRLLRECECPFIVVLGHPEYPPA